MDTLSFRWVVATAPHISSWLSSTGYIDNIRVKLAGDGRFRDASTVFAEQGLNLSGGQSKDLLFDFTAPNNEGLYSFFTEFDENGEIRTQSGFDVKVELVKAQLVVPEIARGVAEVRLQFENKSNRQMGLIVNHYLLKDGVVLQKGTINGTISSGPQEMVFSYNNLMREDGAYTVLAEMLYDGRTKTLSSSLVSNHAPLLEFIPEISTTAGRLVEIKLVARDLDGDNVSVSIGEPFGSDGNWQTQQGDEGNYNVLVEAGDGLLSVLQTVRVHVGEPAVECTIASDCGADGTVSSNVCFENNVVDMHRAFRCKNPGEISSFCAFDDSPIVVQECLNFCLDGSCIGEEQNYQLREQIRIWPAMPISEKDTVELVVDSNRWINAGKLAPDCSNLKIFFNDSQEIDRDVIGCGRPETKVRFAVVDSTHFASGVSNLEYSLYLGNRLEGNAKNDLSKVYYFFEGCDNPIGWQAEGDALIQVGENNSVFGTSCLVSTHGTGQDSVFSLVNFTQQKGTLEFLAKFSEEGKNWRLFSLGNSSASGYPSIGAGLGQHFSENLSTGSFFDTDMLWSKDVWYNFRVEFNFSMNCYDIYLEGQKVSSYCTGTGGFLDHNFSKLWLGDWGSNANSAVFYDEMKLYSRANAAVSLEGESVANTVPYARVIYPNGGEHVGWNDSVKFSVIDVEGNSLLRAGIFFSSKKGGFEQPIVENLLLD
ncbi:MAG: hypothetical protein AABW85_02820, partial [archaeon]